MNDPVPAPRDAPAPQRRGFLESGIRLKLALGVLVLLAIHLIRNADLVGRTWRTAWNNGFMLSEAAAQRRREPSFDLADAIVPTDEIRSGGPAKDGIPALTNPDFIGADEADYLQPTDRVIGVAWQGEARAYPLRILNYHEIVNDRVRETPIAVTYCPLCDSSVVFDRRTSVGERDFGVSGLLYNSNVLMYDRGSESDSLWSQLMATGVSGARARETLKALPLEVTTWSDWSTRHPATKVLSTRTGYQRSYSTSPYSSYFNAPNLMFPVTQTDQRLPLKTPVLGLWTDDASKAYPLSAFSQARLELIDEVGGVRVTLEFNPGANSLRVVQADGHLEWMYSFWFAWYAFRPDTDLYAPQP